MKEGDVISWMSCNRLHYGTLQILKGELFVITEDKRVFPLHLLIGAKGLQVTPPEKWIEKLKAMKRNGS